MWLLSVINLSSSRRFLLALRQSKSMHIIENLFVLQYSYRITTFTLLFTTLIYLRTTPGHLHRRGAEEADHAADSEHQAGEPVRRSDPAPCVAPWVATQPYFCSRMCGQQACATLAEPIRCTSTTLRKASLAVVKNWATWSTGSGPPPPSQSRELARPPTPRAPVSYKTLSVKPCCSRRCATARPEMPPPPPASHRRPRLPYPRRCRPCARRPCAHRTESQLVGSANPQRAPLARLPNSIR